MNEVRTWTGNVEVDAAIVMLDRIDCQPEDDSRADEVESTLRHLHARVEELEAMLDAVGAGGVSAQRVKQAKDHIEQDRKKVAAPVVLPEPGINTASHAGFRVIGYTEQQVRELLAANGITQEKQE